MIASLILEKDNWELIKLPRTACIGTEGERDDINSPVHEWPNDRYDFHELVHKVWR